MKTNRDHCKQTTPTHNAPRNVMHLCRFHDFFRIDHVLHWTTHCCQGSSIQHRDKDMKHRVTQVSACHHTQTEENLPTPAAALSDAADKEFLLVFIAVLPVFVSQRIQRAKLWRLQGFTGVKSAQLRAHCHRTQFADTSRAGICSEAKMVLAFVPRKSILDANAGKNHAGRRRVRV